MHKKRFAVLCLPAYFEDVFYKNAFFGGKDCWGLNYHRDIYRYSGNNGVYHWSGSFSTGISAKDIPNNVKKHFGVNHKKLERSYKRLEKLYERLCN